MNKLQEAIEALVNLIDNFAPPKGESYYWDEARKIIDEPGDVGWDDPSMRRRGHE